MNSKDLKKFLIDSNNAGYAGGKSKQWIHETDHSVTIPFEKGDWESHDNFFGGEPYGGRTVVFQKGNPVWIMVYYGWIDEGEETDPIYGILRGALMRMPEDYPFRGPKEFVEGEFIYSNSWEGDVERFSGEEKIIKNGKLVYKANYMGGLVDQRKGI